MCVLKKLLIKAADQCYHTFDMPLKSCRSNFITSRADISINQNACMRKFVLGLMHHNVLYFFLIAKFLLHASLQ